MLRLLQRLTVLLMVSSLAFSHSHTSAAEPSAMHREREAFARDFAQTVITILHDPKESYGNRKNILRQAFAKSVDIDWIAKFALGRAWRDASEEQREQYTKLYRKFLTETYVTNFAEKPSKSIYSIKIVGVSDETDEEYVVHTRMLLMTKDNLKVDYRVAEKDGKRKVRDIIIENVSLITTHRAEFTGLATSSGVDGVIKTLQARLEAPREMSVSMQ